MSIPRFVAVVGAASVLASCGGPAHPRLVEVEETSQSSSGLSISRLDYSYRNGGELDTVTVAVDNVATQIFDFFYADSKVNRVVMTELDSGFTVAADIEYSDNRVSHATVELRDGNGDIETRTSEFSYMDGRIRLSQWTEIEFDASLGTTASTDGNTEFDYDSDERLERMTHWVGSDASFDEMRYDDDGLLEDIAETFGSSTFITSFSYNEEGRVRSTRQSNGGSHTLRYNDDGKLELDTRALSGDSSRSTRYSYTEGNVDGVIPTPGFSWGHLFDLKGKRLNGWNALADELPVL